MSLTRVCQGLRPQVFVVQHLDDVTVRASRAAMPPWRREHGAVFACSGSPRRSAPLPIIPVRPCPGARRIGIHAVARGGPYGSYGVPGRAGDGHIEEHRALEVYRQGAVLLRASTIRLCAASLAV